MAETGKLSHTAALILHAIAVGYRYGFSIMESTGLPSGTVYPALRRLEAEGLIRSQWEAEAIAEKEQRPPRKYYKTTVAARPVLEASRSRYPLLAALTAPAEEKERV